MDVTIGDNRDTDRPDWQNDKMCSCGGHIAMYGKKKDLCWTCWQKDARADREAGK